MIRSVESRTTFAKHPSYPVTIHAKCARARFLTLPELKDTGVSVTVLMPSMTETNFFKRAEMMDTKAGTANKDDPAVVAKAGFDAMMAGKDKVTPTVKNKIMGAVADLLPDALAAKVHRGLSEPGSGG